MTKVGSIEKLDSLVFRPAMVQINIVDFSDMDAERFNIYTNFLKNQFFCCNVKYLHKAFLRLNSFNVKARTYF